jgi:hypothetical protein
MKIFVYLLVLLPLGCSNNSATGGSDLAVALPDLLSPADLRSDDAGFLAPCAPSPAADDPLSISGTVQDLLNMPLSGITVTLHKADGTLVATAQTGDGGTTVTGADGDFSLTFATGGTPLDGYLAFTGSGVVSTRSYPARPFANSISNRGFSVATTEQLGLAYQSVGVTLDAAKTSVVAAISRCNFAPIQGATLSVVPAPARIAYDTGAGPLPSTSATHTSRDGLGFALNVPAGASTVAAILDNQTFPTVSIPLQPGELAIVSLHP